MEIKNKVSGGEPSQEQSCPEVFDNIMGAVHEPLVVLDADLKVVKANRSFYQMFHVHPNELEGILLFDLDNRQWNIPKLRDLLEEIIPKNAEVNDFVVEHIFDVIGRKILHLNARKIYTKTSHTPMILLAIEDMTEREEQKRDLELLVQNRTFELVLARDEAEERRKKAEADFAEIRELQDQLEAERAYLQDEIKLEGNHQNIIGQSDSLKHVLLKIEQVAGSETTVLILGETGTGKELAARAIHALSSRKNRTLVKVNCACLSASLIESDLFGYEKGAFTGSLSRHLGRFEVANGTTIFLDEIGELPIELQAKLLRVLQEGEFERLGGSQTIKVDTRIVAATNRNLEKEVREGRFREDLWYRLNIFPITMPPLRERLDDIPLLVDAFVKKIARRLGKTIEIIPAVVMAALQEYHWPGNVRELENVLERAVINSTGPKLRLVDELKKSFKNLPSSPKTLEAYEQEYILRVLELSNWKVSGKNSASEILGLDRSTLRARMAKLNIEKP
ncbi:MAG: sigma 54-interacting transcriptional regulator [Desulfobulbaceae bacterium]|nr:sigma 54-interacting transcriptional regulator [Desulfobulbaceae bacterium]